MIKILINYKMVLLSDRQTSEIDIYNYNGKPSIIVMNPPHSPTFFPFDTEAIAKDAFKILAEALLDNKTSIKITTELDVKSEIA